MTSDGTVTTLLEELAGEAIRLAALHHGGPAPAGALAALADGIGSGSVLNRSTLLVGASSGTTLVRARSVLAAETLPGPVHRDLTTTAEPIGRVLRRWRVETFRELLFSRALFAGEAPDPLDGAKEAAAPRGPDQAVTGALRVYRVFIGGRPAMVVGEVFTAACLRLGDPPGPGEPQSTTTR
ncbi:chorismate--pyruvate lyase family protein [Kitasatospora sp. NBC_01266]|uniref:chorismate--pyruvate lyase family protein n=1 Tax=Kitasatospora sp. NBC_01266 TaxID=2903572 RepID=UPI002E347D0A|nr:chorismate pyruvate-lyase family protein [Kitasatospora sp. NBC_01266]